MAYEASKLADRDTAAQCAAQNIRLIPMVVETLGGWGPEAQAVFRKLATATAVRTGLPVSSASNQLYQRLGIQLQRANARAILSRASGSANPSNTTLATSSLSEAALVLAAGEAQ